MESPEKTTPAVVDLRGTPAPSWTVSTNWTIAGGSISSSVAVDSSFSPLDDGDAAKSPLILYPSSPDPSPCEITISFPQKHEVRQVYVRSTARFYEMYYASECHGSVNEYLLTVRCGIAEREGQVLRAVGVEEAVSLHQRSDMRVPNGGGLGTDNTSKSSDDEWVAVKGNLSPLKSRDAEYLYEATAEIADANPCMSFTIRLLSLVNKGCSCVEEVYVFADPVDADNLNNQVGPEENTSGNLMAMLVPTILQLSKSKALDQDSGNVLANEKHKLVVIGNKERDPTNAAQEIQHEDASSSLVKQETELPDTVVSSVVPVQLGISQHVADAEGKPTSQPEGILDLLLSRVNRIEDLLLRFEERMLKPLNSIDERLRGVEHQLDVLTKKTEKSGLISCTRISAPEFSCGESESNSFYNNGCMDSGYVASEDKKDLPASSDISEILVPVDASKMFHSFQVSAPEFSNYDVEDEDLAPETVEEDPEDQDLTLETAKEAPDNQTIRVKAPEFSTEDESIDVASASPEVDPYIHADFSCFKESDMIEEYLYSTASNKGSMSSDKSAMESSCYHYKHKTVDEGDESWFCNMLNIASAEDVGADHIVDDSYNMKAGTLTGNILDHNNTGVLKEISKNQTADGNDPIQEIATSVEPVASADRTPCGSVQDSIDNHVGFDHFASMPKYFDAQILDMKFVSYETSDTKSSLEALLSGTSDLNADTSAVDEVRKDDLDLVEQSNLIPVEDWGTTNGLVTVDMDYYSVREAPRDVESDNLEDTRICSSRQDIYAESLI